MMSNRNTMKKSTRKMSEIEKAYVGAMIDGEGGFYEYSNQALKIRLGNSDYEIISALLRATGVGKVYWFPRRKPHHKDALHWTVLRRNDVIDIAKQIRKYSSKAQKLLLRIE